jgi:hypothetical protein
MIDDLTFEELPPSRYKGTVERVRYGFKAANIGIKQPDALVGRSDSLNRPTLTPRKQRHAVVGKAVQP